MLSLCDRFAKVYTRCQCQQSCHDGTQEHVFLRRLVTGWKIRQRCFRMATKWGQSSCCQTESSRTVKTGRREEPTEEQLLACILILLDSIHVSCVRVAVSCGFFPVVVEFELNRLRVKGPCVNASRQHLEPLHPCLRCLPMYLWENPARGPSALPQDVLRSSATRKSRLYLKLREVAMSTISWMIGTIRIHMDGTGGDPGKSSAHGTVLTPGGFRCRRCAVGLSDSCS